LERTVQGKSHTWQVSDAPIGGGDAGEVYAVACVEQPELTGVMKTPARIATGGTIQRQAGQIAQEALALTRLDGLPQGKAHPPRLLDSATELTHGTANYFIVSESAHGDNLAAMLSQKRQSGKPFPRRVIITILDALFDLFARAHRAGVLWNDVKLDHIYWHNPTGDVSVIDWGNALFLEDDESSRRLPRWEDYRQLVDTLGTFLQQNAPDLFDDLGWEEFQGQELDLPRVSVLARRIAYQQQVIAHRVMEYQSLIRVVLKENPTLQGLSKIKTYHGELEKIGAPIEVEEILSYSRKLILSELEASNTQTSVKAAAIVWELFDPSLALSWRIISEYFRHTDLLSHPLLPDLTRYTLYENWCNALWTIISIAQDIQPVEWWRALMPVLRQKALSLATPPPYQTCQSLLTWAESQNEKDINLTSTLVKILDQWHQKGVDLEESPFDYALFEFLWNETSFPRRLRAELNQSLAAGREAIRELLQAWTNMSWESLPKAFRRIACWDPDRWGIIHLAEAVEDFHVWLNELYEGPEADCDVNLFIQGLVEKRPSIERLLGTPKWLHDLLETLNDIVKALPLDQHRAAIQVWCPWLLDVIEAKLKENR